MKSDVMFVATYFDGSEEWFGIPADRLRGDQSVGEFAQEQQRIGWLPAGRIVSVKRQILSAI
jgi:hypothetical protein